MKKLSPRQRLFIHEYLVDLNATQAARRCGYSPKTARQQGARLLSKAAIKKVIDELMERRTGKAVMTREEILEELSLIGRVDLKNYQVIEEGGTIRVKRFDEMPEGASRALESIEETRTIAESKDGKETILVADRIKIKALDKIRALELLARHKGMLPMKVEGNFEIKAKLSMDELKKSIKEVMDGSGN
jgi:phage terminase small subunit